MELITGENDKGRRLDRILRKALPGYPLPLIHRLLRQKRILIDGVPGKAQTLVDCNVKISIPSLKDEPVKNNTDNSLKKSASILDKKSILWESCGLLAVNKPSGITVHGPHSLDSMVQVYLRNKLPPSLSFKPGPLHRLDKPSSGIVIFSVNLEGARLFSSLLHEQKVKKTYLAVVEGIVKKDEFWKDELLRDKEKKKTFITNNDSCGKTALTKIIPLSNKGNLTLIKAEITTGRTHQIRAQAASHGFPLAGDIKYGGSKRKDGFFLHAWKLDFLDYSIEAPLPQVDHSLQFMYLYLT